MLLTLASGDSSGRAPEPVGLPADAGLLVHPGRKPDHNRRSQARPAPGERPPLTGVDPRSAAHRRRALRNRRLPRHVFPYSFPRPQQRLHTRTCESAAHRRPRNRKPAAGAWASRRARSCAGSLPPGCRNPPVSDELRPGMWAGRQAPAPLVSQQHRTAFIAEPVGRPVAPPSSTVLVSQPSLTANRLRVGIRPADLCARTRPNHRMASPPCAPPGTAA